MKTRVVRTHMHAEDEWFSSLRPAMRYFYIYLFTNKYIDKTGAYRLPDRVAVFETGATLEEWKEAKELFIEAKKIVCIDEWIVILNAKKNSDYTGPKNEASFMKEFNSLPKAIQDTLSIVYGYPIGSVPIPYTYSTDTTINNKLKIINNNSKRENNNVEEFNDDIYPEPVEESEKVTAAKNKIAVMLRKKV